MIHYDPDKDRSEDCGWKKVKDEYVPTEQEQNRWAAGMVLFTVVISMLGVFYGLQ